MTTTSQATTLALIGECQLASNHNGPPLSLRACLYNFTTSPFLRLAQSSESYNNTSYKGGTHSLAAMVVADVLGLASLDGHVHYTHHFFFSRRFFC